MAGSRGRGQGDADTGARYNSSSASISKNLSPRLTGKTLGIVTEEARNSDKGVLVHCLAGISRSVTITVAYLMHKCSLSLNDAFNLVRSRKSNVAPNFHFMQQLHCFEAELREHRDRGLKGSSGPEQPCSCPATSFLSPVDLGLSPDSGIEFDRWAASTPAE
jgi:dual specificity MAP kinase phosphatase